MKRILVAVDGSAVEASVLERAIELAVPLGAKLLLFRAVGAPLELPADALSVSPNELPQILMSRAEGALRRLAERAPAGLVEAVRAEVGQPWRAVVEAAQREHADLIVIGSHGYGGIDRLLGTTAAKIVDHARCSVLVVRSTP